MFKQKVSLSTTFILFWISEVKSGSHQFTTMYL